MKSNGIPVFTDSKNRKSCGCSFCPAASLLCLLIFMGSSFIVPEDDEKSSRWGLMDSLMNSKFNKCENRCRPIGSEVLPEGIVSCASDLEMRQLWGKPRTSFETPATSPTGLFAAAVGIQQKDLVNNLVTKFLSGNFAVMLFHYDEVVDDWKDFNWSNHVIHVSAANQTKWWFAKRFLHPDIVAEYSYIFLWDEDLGVENFNLEKYVSIVKSEGLEISQPALDPSKSEVHHQITARGRRAKVHRRTFSSSSSGKGCNASSTAPPCTGWIEMMAPVFSRLAWQCVWYMIQNDLIHAWGLDMQLGYCALGDRTKSVGVVDSEYVVHYGRPTLGGPDINKQINVDLDSEVLYYWMQFNSSEHGETSERREANISASTEPHRKDPRVEVRRQAYIELDIFRKRWKKAVGEDECWSDPYPEQVLDML